MLADRPAHARRAARPRGRGVVRAAAACVRAAPARAVGRLDVQRRLGGSRGAARSTQREDVLLGHAAVAAGAVDARRGRCRARRRSAARPASSARGLLDRRRLRVSPARAGAAASSRRRGRRARPARPARRISPGVVARAGSPRRRCDPREHRADLDGLARLDEDLGQPARRRRRDLGVDLVGGDLAERLVGARPRRRRLLVPLDDRALGDRRRPSGASSTSTSSVVEELSAGLPHAVDVGQHRLLERRRKGIGTSGVATRRTGPSRCSKACSAISAATCGAGGARRVRLVDDHDLRASCATLREDRLLVERDERAQVEHLDATRRRGPRSPPAPRAPSRRRRSPSGRSPSRATRAVNGVS